MSNPFNHLGSIFDREDALAVKEITLMSHPSFKNCCTGSSRLMRISLLRFFKTCHKYFPYANFGLFISLVLFFGQKIATFATFADFLTYATYLYLAVLSFESLVFIIQSLQRSPIPQTSFLVGIFRLFL